MLAAVAEFQHDLTVANTREGLAAARARGRTGGRKPKLTAVQVRDAQAMYDSRAWTVQAIAELYGVPRTTLYNHLRTGNPAAAEDASADSPEHGPRRCHGPSRRGGPAEGRPPRRGASP